MKLIELYSTKFDSHGYVQSYYAWEVIERPRSRNVDLLCLGFDGDGREEAEQWLNSLFTLEEVTELEGALIRERPVRYLAYPHRFAHIVHEFPKTCDEIKDLAASRKPGRKRLWHD